MFEGGCFFEPRMNTDREGDAMSLFSRLRVFASSRETFPSVFIRVHTWFINPEQDM